MDKDRVDEILDYYRDKLKYVGNAKPHHEVLKWTAAVCWKKNFDIEAEDFGGMLKRCVSAWRNLIDYGGTSPFAAIIKLCQKGRVEEVRELFRELIREDNDDLENRFDRICSFYTRINERLKKEDLFGWRNENTVRSTIMILGLLRPEKDYMFKSMPAQYFVQYTEYGFHIGQGKYFNFSNYYRMCEELIETLKRRPDIEEAVQKMVETEAEETNLSEVRVIDNKWHIFAYDVIYSVYTYRFYDNKDMSSRKSSQKQKASGKTTEQDNRAAMDAATREIERIESIIEEVTGDIGKAALPEITGEKVIHVKYGEGTVRAQDGHRLTVQFGDQTRRMDMRVMMTSGSVLDVPEDIGETCLYILEKDKELTYWRRKLEEAKTTRQLIGKGV